MTRNRLICCLAAMLTAGSMLRPSHLRADEPATTAQLPAALQALGADDSLILSQSQADQVRGEAIGPIALISVISLTDPLTDTTHLAFFAALVGRGGSVVAAGSVVGGPIIFLDILLTQDSVRVGIR